MLGLESRRAVLVVAAWAVAFLIWPFVPGPVVGNPLDDFAALEMQMELAAEELAQGGRSMRTHGGMAGHGHEGMPVDKRPRILQRMDAIVAQLADGPEAGTAAAKTLRWSLELRDERSLDRFRRMVARHADTAEFPEVRSYV